MALWWPPLPCLALAFAFALRPVVCHMWVQDVDYSTVRYVLLLRRCSWPDVAWSEMLYGPGRRDDRPTMHALVLPQPTLIILLYTYMQRIQGTTLNNASSSSSPSPSPSWAYCYLDTNFNSNANHFLSTIVTHQALVQPQTRLTPSTMPWPPL